MSILDTFPAAGMLAERASVVNRAVGTFHFDVVTSEGHDSTLRLTENPIESGAAVADHAVLEPKEITINGVMVGYEPPDFANRLLGGRLTAVKALPLPLSIRAVTVQAESLASRALSLVQLAKEEVPRALAPFLPDYGKSAADASSTLDRVGKAYNALLGLQKSGAPVDVQTGLRQYRNMMLVNIGIMQLYDGSAEFTLTLREIFIVESQTAQGLHPDLKKSAAKKTQLGKTQPKASAAGNDKKSAIKTIAGWLGG
ncbi:hypothetical protein SMQC20_28770 [Serratia marcescens]|nr:hypothetical protein SMQC20_28770 [Serratia marcescens]